MASHLSDGSSKAIIRTLGQQTGSSRVVTLTGSTLTFQTSTDSVGKTERGLRFFLCSPSLSPYHLLSLSSFQFSLFPSSEREIQVNSFRTKLLNEFCSSLESGNSAWIYLFILRGRECLKLLTFLMYVRFWVKHSVQTWICLKIASLCMLTYLSMRLASYTQVFILWVQAVSDGINPVPSVKIANVCVIIELWGFSEPIRRASFCVFVQTNATLSLVHAFFPYLRNMTSVLVCMMCRNFIVKDSAWFWVLEKERDFIFFFRIIPSMFRNHGCIRHSGHFLTISMVQGSLLKLIFSFLIF